MRIPPQELKRTWNDRYPENGMAVIFVRQERCGYLIKSVFLPLTAKKILLKWSDANGRKRSYVEAA